MYIRKIIGTFIATIQILNYIIATYRVRDKLIVFKRATFGSIVMFTKFVSINQKDIKKVLFITNSDDRIVYNVKYIDTKILIQILGVSIKFNNKNIIFPCSRKLQFFYSDYLIYKILSDKCIYTPLTYINKYKLFFNNDKDPLLNLPLFFISKCNYLKNINNNQNVIIYWRNKDWVEAEQVRNFNVKILYDIINCIDIKYNIYIYGDINDINLSDFWKKNIKLINMNTLEKNSFKLFLRKIKCAKYLIGGEGGGLWLGYLYSVPVFMISRNQDLNLFRSKNIVDINSFYEDDLKKFKTFLNENE